MLKVAESGLFNADIAGPINLFTGAGFSTLAENVFKASLPVGDALKNLLVKEFALQAYASLDLASLYAVLLADRRDALRTYLDSVFSVDKYDNRYDSLRRLDVSFLYSTNIDDLPFHIFNARNGDGAKVIHDFGIPVYPTHACKCLGRMSKCFPLAVTIPIGVRW